jgi:propanol-preferring alcohol dehydrogenase
MSDIPSFSYHMLWEERVVRSVANLTRKDAEDFLKVTSEIEIITETQFFTLQHANDALERLRNGKIQGAAVLLLNN